MENSNKFVRKALCAALLAATLPTAVLAATSISINREISTSELWTAPSEITFYLYDSQDATVPVASQTFDAGLWLSENDYKVGKSMRVSAQFTNTEAIDESRQLWMDTAVDGTLIGTRQALGEEAPLLRDISVDTYIESRNGGIIFADGSVQVTSGITTETDPGLAAHTGTADAHHTRYSDPEAVTAIKAADGAGSGLDADQLDGLHADAFAMDTHSHNASYVNITGDTMTGKLIVNTTLNFNIKGNAINGPTNGYLGISGTTEFDSILSADWDGLEIGVAGISVGGTNMDNFGVIGHSNYVGVRGEHSADPINNYAELGVSGTGIRAKGTTLAGDFIGNVNVSADLTVTGSTTIDGGLTLNNASSLLMKDASATTRINMHYSNSGGAILMYDTNGTATIDMVAAEGSTQGASLRMHQANGINTIDLDADFQNRGAYISFNDEAGNRNVVIEGHNSTSGLGRITTDEIVITGGADLSEQFNIEKTDIDIAAGMIVSIDPSNPGQLQISSTAYDSKVAGIVSGAGGVVPGMMMGQKGSLADGDHPVALTGRVYAWVDTTNGAITPGDLLTTSSTPGHAMKATNHDKAMGAIIGKAMTPLDSGKGLVLVLVSLQ
jgi:hypothetical protein